MYEQLRGGALTLIEFFRKSGLLQLSIYFLIDDNWRWRELHPRPKDSSLRGLHAQSAIDLIPQASANEILKDDPPRSFPWTRRRGPESNLLFRQQNSAGIGPVTFASS